MLLGTALVQNGMTDMGWCSATEIFDTVADVVLREVQDDGIRISVLYKLAVALEQHDWDCQSDSCFYDHPLVERVFKQLHPHWFEGD